LPDDASPWKNLGFLYQQKITKFAEANQTDSVEYYNKLRLEVYSKAYKIDSKDEETIRILAGMHIQKGEYDEALSILQPTLASTKNAKLFRIAADAYLEKGDTAKALEMLTQTESLEPDNVDYISTIGLFYYYAKNFDKAAEYFGKISAKQPDNTEALYNQSLALFYAEKKTEAEEVAKTLLKKDPKNADAWDQLALIWATTNRGKEAKIAEKVGIAITNKNFAEANSLAQQLNLGVEIKE